MYEWKKLGGAAMRPPIAFMLLDMNSGSQNLYKNKKCADFD